MASETELLVLPSVYRGPSRALRLRRAMRRYPVASAAAFVILAFIIIAVFAGVLAPYDPAKTEGAKRLADPSLSHPFGLDGLGRDVLSRVIYGSRVSLRVGLVAVFLLFGVVLFGGMMSKIGAMVWGSPREGVARDESWTVGHVPLLIMVAALIGLGVALPEPIRMLLTRAVTVIVQR